MRIWLEKMNEREYGFRHIKYLQNSKENAQIGLYAEILYTNSSIEDIHKTIQNHLSNMIICLFKEGTLKRQYTKITSFSELEFCEELQPYAKNIQSWFCGSTLITETPDLLKDL